MSKAEIVHFTVEGAFITDTARRFWNEENAPERAMSLVMCMHGITRGEALDVLEGRLKLVGDSGIGITLEPDDFKSKTLDEIFRKNKAQIAELEDERQDLGQLVTGDTIMVASPTGARRVPRRKAASFMGTRAGRLGEGYEFDDVLADPKMGADRNERAKKKNQKPPKPLRVWQQMEDSVREERLERRAKPPRFESSMEGVARVAEETEALPETDEEREARYKLEEEQHLKNAQRHLKPQLKVTTDTGWLSPEGKFYPCGYAQHALIAYALGLSPSPQHHGIKPEGWLRFGVSDDRQYIFDDEMHTPPTKIQRKLVEAWCKKQKIDLPFGFRKEDE